MSSDRFERRKTESNRLVGVCERAEEPDGCRLALDVDLLVDAAFAGNQLLDRVWYLYAVDLYIRVAAGARLPLGWRHYLHTRSNTGLDSRCSS